MLVVDHVDFAYQRGRPILSDWSHAFLPGVTALTGPSGRGKTTLLYLLGLVLRPGAGTIHWHNQSVSGLPDRSRAWLRATEFGFVFQDAALDPTRTIMDNVLEGCLYRGASRSEARDEADRLLQEFGVSLQADSRPGQVSGGQAQRIALCRALVHRPSLVLADEPTGNLDPDSAGIVFNALKSRGAEGTTVIVVTHDQELAQRCDHRVEL